MVAGELYRNRIENTLIFIHADPFKLRTALLEREERLPLSGHEIHKGSCIIQYKMIQYKPSLKQAQSGRSAFSMLAHPAIQLFGQP